MSKQFKRSDAKMHPRLRTGWRKPHGIDSKVRIHRRGYVLSPKIGYATARSLRDRHPGAKLPEKLVSSGRDLEAAQGCVVRLAAGLGKSKKKALAEKARAKGLKVLNG
ncbi:50S ribosomal protein L32e [Candidatus Micrarchaeota archaeon CG_4_10_14_0_2_um_filter_60_11]|nr:MAG: hypothetical protein AUJ16_01930 [Candidatus Micrarchaeota archaeon CG1_02_60_51]PIN96507.1 MAG: 50S ribosomal protein L32e [Candidatus Micrarchaeota archaeon CG10_big_fil_rev_8_21_14_0_10_60_32]PIO01879.1 MAG: 50S ribosomal protein L32e [Candidatus Micrarchaeota archaeon CG09_land_8_20_14_0_10_60_16]PIY91558.1 MAG: 50S ribosomal protein L32e [Candidatus Micrarchaeota archaeon CG_4_10_14_0_8_um_filter_60_7]PIZ90839.1 MAG: 50S ribosomal protein L32e [Candidatus Micrarchaeota archaeon CG_